MPRRSVSSTRSVSSRSPESAVCKVQIVHKEAVNKVAAEMPDSESLLAAAELFKAFGDVTRIRILSALIISEMCVCDLAASLRMTQSAISHQLRVLKQEDLVKFRRDGKTVYYSLKDDHVKTIFQQGLKHIKDDNRTTSGTTPEETTPEDAHETVHA